MNLHAIVSPIIAPINPSVTGTALISTGYTTAPDGTQVPTYTAAANIPMQVQALSSSDLKKIDNISMQSLMRGVYLNGNIEGIDRPAGKGGDFLVFLDQGWLVTQVLEPWDTDGWCKVAVTLQANFKTTSIGNNTLLVTTGVI